MNPEKFPPRNPQTDKEIIDALIHGNLEEKGGHFIQGKSAEEVLKRDEDLYESNDKDEDDDEGELEPWQTVDTSEKWKEQLEKGLYRRIGKNEPSYEFYNVLESKFPKLGVSIKGDVTDTEGKYRPDYCDIYIDKEKGYKKFINSLETHPIIELLCSPYGSRSFFDMNLAKVRSMSVLPEDMLQRIKSRYLYLDYEYHKTFDSEETLNGMRQEIINTLSTFLGDDELKTLFASIIEEELESRGIL